MATQWSQNLQLPIKYPYMILLHIDREHVDINPYQSIIVLSPGTFLYRGEGSWKLSTSNNASVSNLVVNRSRARRHQLRAFNDSTIY